MPLPLPFAVIPWFELPSVSFGPFTIQSFGVLSALGILAAVQLSARAAARMGKDPKVIVDYAVVGVIAGVVGGHLVHLLAYHREELADPVRIFKFWEGLSSMGGLAGGVIAAWLWFRAKHVRFRDYADAFALGIAPGWGIARIGCFTVHDHPGVLTSFPLAVAFPGGARHDLGLYEAIVLLSLGAMLWWMFRHGVARGRLLAVLALTYGIARFLLDFLRATDVAYADARYHGLTPAQYAAFGLFAYAAWAFWPRRAAAAVERAPEPRARRSGS